MAFISKTPPEFTINKNEGFPREKTACKPFSGESSPGSYSAATVEQLARVYQSRGLVGRVFRTLTYYARHTRAATRPGDLELMLALSAAEAQAVKWLKNRRSKP